MTPPENDLRDAVADPALRKEVRDCIGETIPLRRRWVSAIIAGPITRLLTRSTAAETDLAKARADLERVKAERDRCAVLAGEGFGQAIALLAIHERWKAASVDESAARIITVICDECREAARAAEAEATRLRALLVERDEALTDMLAGWLYIREHHGDLYGVG